MPQTTSTSLPRPRTSDGRARMPDLPDRLAVLVTAADEADHAVIGLTHALVAARSGGATWQDIADTCGLGTRSRAWERYAGLLA